MNKKIYRIEIYRIGRVLVTIYLFGYIVGTQRLIASKLESPTGYPAPANCHEGGKPKLVVGKP